VLNTTTSCERLQTPNQHQVSSTSEYYHLEYTTVGGGITDKK